MQHAAANVNVEYSAGHFCLVRQHDVFESGKIAKREQNFQDVTAVHLLLVLLQLLHERVHFKPRKRFCEPTLYVGLYQSDVPARALFNENEWK